MRTRITDRRARARRVSFSLAAIAVVFGASACGSSVTPPKPSPAPTPQLTADDVCGFLPRALTLQILGATDVTVGPLHFNPPIVSCQVSRTGETATALEVTVNDFDVTNLSYVMYKVKQAPRDWLLFPEDAPTGFSEPQYDSTLPGHEGQGATAVYAYGRYWIDVRLYQPTPGRSPRADAAELAQLLPAKLGLSPTHTPYPSYSPSGPSPEPDATIEPTPSTSATSSVPTPTP